MTNKKNGTLYTGIKNDVVRRVFEYKKKLVRGFCSRYNLTLLVYYEIFGDAYSAIAREKQIKGWLRSKKIALIEGENPEWKDLSEGWYDDIP
jgi:putative endonuclease